jgi:hypothetical protein
LDETEDTRAAGRAAAIKVQITSKRVFIVASMLFYKKSLSTLFMKQGEAGQE